MLNVAIALARRGFRVFPLVPGGKKPLRKGWQQAATDDVDRILDEWPAGNCNVGIATGQGLVVVDVDPDRGGMESLAKLDLPSTFTVRTARGGLHLYFKMPPGQFIPNSVDKLGPGIDVRGYGGYVVGPGSIINGSTYVERG